MCELLSYIYTHLTCSANAHTYRKQRRRMHLHNTRKRHVDGSDHLRRTREATSRGGHLCTRPRTHTRTKQMKQSPVTYARIEGSVLFSYFFYFIYVFLFFYSRQIKTFILFFSLTCFTFPSSPINCTLA